MSTINTDLIAHIYAASESPLTNDELYREVQRKTGMSDAELHELKEFGSDKTRTSGVKHKVRWFQQTLRQAGVIERVPEKRGVWRYASKTKTNLHESWEKLCVVGFSTSLGASVFGNAYAFFSNITEQIHLCLTSPPYLLRNSRDYGHGGGRGEQAYIDWLLRILEPIVKQLVPGASVALNITQDSFNRGRPSRSLYLERLTLALCDKLGLELMDRLQWVNRSKPPSPTHWACKQRVQLCSSYEPVLWFTNDASKVRSNNLRVLQPHSDQHLKLQAAGGENRTTFYGDGAYQLKSGSFGNKTEGTIPKNTLFYGNSCADTRFCHSIARELGFPLHGATSPTRLAAFLIEFLTEPGDLVVDPFAGLHKVPIAAERLGRRWLATDKIMEWLAISRNLFTAAPEYKSNPMLDELAELYRT
ncbi:DNA methyltransferase [Escherichia coli]|uniref:DNA methyltransferase n=1 Tax=Escherichia coli TaxID=562 RepID=UPI00351C4395